MRAAIAVGPVGLWVHRHQGGLPLAPILCGLHVHGRIGILQKAVVSRDEIAIAVSRWDTRAEARPLCREQGCNATIEPVDLGSPGGGDAAEHHFRDASRMSLGVREPKGRAPRTAKQPPCVNIQVLSKMLQVRQEMCSRIDRKIGAQVTGVRRTPATSSLVEQHDPVGFRIEVATYPVEPPEPGPPWRTTAGLPCGLPQTSQYTRFPSPTSSIPWSYGSMAG